MKKNINAIIGRRYTPISNKEALRAVVRAMKAAAKVTYTDAAVVAAQTVQG